ncbi:MAG: hypothetical protein GX538_00305 [Gammaproteobacteria bacterium]|nr:hypothetical protein [Gammaproteobacteria bacterium]
MTEVTRPVLDLLDYAKDACIAAGVPARVYTGTTYAGLAETLPALLVESKGKPCAVVCYSGSKYGNAPRRVSSVAILVIQGHTRALSGTATALEAAHDIIEKLDDVIYQDVAGGYPITDHWRLDEDEVVDIDGINAAACVVLNFNVEDY